MARPNLTRAQRLRAMREAFELGRQYGCTPIEAVPRHNAEQSLARLESVAQRQRARLDAAAQTTAKSSEITPHTGPARPFWWNND